MTRTEAKGSASDRLAAPSLAKQEHVSHEDQRRMVLVGLEIPGLTAHVFEMAKDEALRCSREGIPAEPDEIRRLDRRARMVIALFGKQEEIRATDVAKLLARSIHQASIGRPPVTLAGVSA